jgi:hypothetical protein
LIKPVRQRAAEVAKRHALAKVFSHNQDPKLTLGARVLAEAASDRRQE